MHRFLRQISNTFWRNFPDHILTSGLGLQYPSSDTIQTPPQYLVSPFDNHSFLNLNTNITRLDTDVLNHRELDLDLDLSAVQVF